MSTLRLLLLLVAATALGPMAMQIFLPALPAIQHHHNVSAATAQLAFSLSAFAMAVATLVYGPVSDHYGRRPAMLAGLVIFLIGSLLCVLAASIEVLIIGRVIQAAGGCVGMVLGRAIVRDLYDRERSAQLIAYITMAMVAAPMVSPAIGGLLTDAWSWRAVFVFGGLFGIIVLAAIWLDLRETAPRVGQSTSLAQMGRSFALLLRSAAFVGYAGQAAFSIAVFFGFLAAAPYLIIVTYQRPASEYGILFILVSGAFMLGNFLAARLTPRIGLERMVLLGSAGSLLGTLGALGFALAGYWTASALFLPMSVGAFAQGLAVPNTQAAVVSLQPELAGAASGLAGFLQMGVAAAVAQIIGSIQTGTPYPVTIGMTVCSSLALAFAVLAVVESRGRSSA